MSFKVAAVVCIKQLSEPKISVATTLTSCALTVIDVASTVFSAGANPFLFGAGVLGGFATSVFIEDKLQKGLDRENPQDAVMFRNLTRSLYSLFMGAMPVGLAQISSFAQRYYGSSLLLGFRLGNMATHTYSHIQAYRFPVRQ